MVVIDPEQAIDINGWKQAFPMHVLSDERFREAAADVVVRRRAHDQYASDAGAAAALRRRVPGHAEGVYAEALALLFRLYADTVRVVQASALCTCTPEDGERYSRAWAEVARALATAHPNLPVASLCTTFVNWVHYWHCLR